MSTDTKTSPTSNVTVHVSPLRPSIWMKDLKIGDIIKFAYCMAFGVGLRTACICEMRNERTNAYFHDELAYLTNTHNSGFYHDLTYGIDRRFRVHSITNPDNAQEDDLVMFYAGEGLSTFTLIAI